MIFNHVDDPMLHMPIYKTLCKNVALIYFRHNRELRILLNNSGWIMPRPYKRNQSIKHQQMSQFHILLLEKPGEHMA